MPNQRRIRALEQAPLPLQAICIGRWAPMVEYPHRHYLDPVPGITPLVHGTLQRSFEQIYEEEDKAGTNLEGTIVALGSAKMCNIATSASKIYQLDNPEALFSDAIQRQDNRKWIENTLKTYGAIYMIIGYQTLLDAEHGKESSATFQAPATAAVTATTGVPLGGDSLYPSVGPENYKSTNLKLSFNSPGEQVVAVQYRRIRFQFFRSCYLDKEALETTTRWQYPWEWRCPKPLDAIDVVEASLSLEDLDEDDLDEDEESKRIDDLLSMSSDDDTCNTTKKADQLR